MSYLDHYETMPSEFWSDYREVWQAVDMHGNRPRTASVTISTCKESGLDMFKARWHNGVARQSAECYFLEEAHELLQARGFELIDRVNLD